MTVERLIRIMAGTVVLISLALGYHGSPIFNGLAIALIFGIAVSTMLTLVVIPVLYYAVYRKRYEAA